MFRRRRPLLGAAVVGGTAYAAGRHAQAGRQQEADQEARLAELEYQQQQPQYAPPPPAAAAPASSGGLTDDGIARLQKLQQLRDSGVLTEEEFLVQKERILQGI